MKLMRTTAAALTPDRPPHHRTPRRNRGGLGAQGCPRLARPDSGGPRTTLLPRTRYSAVMGRFSRRSVETGQFGQNCRVSGWRPDPRRSVLVRLAAHRTAARVAQPSVILRLATSRRARQASRSAAVRVRSCSASSASCSARSQSSMLLTTWIVQFALPARAVQLAGGRRRAVHSPASCRSCSRWSAPQVIDGCLDAELHGLAQKQRARYAELTHRKDRNMNMKTDS